MNNYSLEQLVQLINDLNRSLIAKQSENGIVLILDSMPITKVKFPRGYYYNHTRGISNKYHEPKGFEFVSYPTKII